MGGGHRYPKSNNNQLSSRASGFLCGRAKNYVAKRCPEMRLYFKKHGITNDAVMILVAWANQNRRRDRAAEGGGGLPR